MEASTGFLVLAPLLIAAASGALVAGDVDRKKAQARLNELSNRLGLGLTRRSDLRARMTWVYRRYGFYVFVYLKDWLIYLEPSYVPADYVLVDKAIAIALPQVGVRSDYEPLVPWLAREIGHWLGRSEIRRAIESGFPLNQVTGLLHGRDPHDFEELIDWFEAESPNLFALTIDDAFAASQAWHEKFAKTQEFGHRAIDGIEVARWGDIYVLDRLVTPDQLTSEGVSMGHCVGRYWPNVRDGRSIILSVREMYGIPVGTLELTVDRNGYAIVQFMGPRDVPVSRPEILIPVLELLESWGIEVGEWRDLFILMRLPDTWVAYVDTGKSEGPVSAIAKKLFEKVVQSRVYAGVLRELAELGYEIYKMDDPPDRDEYDTVEEWHPALREWKKDQIDPLESKGFDTDRFDDIDELERFDKDAEYRRLDGLREFEYEDFKKAMLDEIEAIGQQVAPWVFWREAVQKSWRWHVQNMQGHGGCLGLDISDWTPTWSFQGEDGTILEGLEGESGDSAWDALRNAGALVTDSEVEARIEAISAKVKLPVSWPAGDALASIRHVLEKAERDGQELGDDSRRILKRLKRST